MTALQVRTAWTPFAPFDIAPGGKFGTEAKVKAFYNAYVSRSLFRPACAQGQGLSDAL